MKFTFALHRDEHLTHRNKYRKQVFGAGEGQVWTGEVVSIGNFASKDLFCDNSVEISCPYSTTLKANFVRLSFDDWHTIGPITNWEYINEQNTRITYAVDAYSSAVASGRLENIGGLCERVNSYCLEHFLNLLPEPFAPSDIKQANPDLTLQFTNFLDAVEGFEGGTTWLTDPQVNFVLTVSPAIAEWGGWNPFATPLYFEPEFKPKATLNFRGNDFTRHYSGVFRGTPLVFPSVDEARNFIRRILSGCGFVTRTTSSGYKGQDLQGHVSLAYIDSPGGATVQTGDSNFNQQWTETETSTETYDLTETGLVGWGSGIVNETRRGTGNVKTETTTTKGSAPKGLEYCRPITSADIYNLYVLPKVFCRDNPNQYYDSIEITGFRNYLKLDVIAPELPDKAKLAAYPYCYNKLVTANGDVVDIIPQSDYQTNLTVLDPNYKVKVKVGFFGGDTPRLMGTILSARAGNNTHSEVESWFTIRSYPALTSALNDDLNMQRQKDYSNTKQIGAAGANARIQSRLNSPLLSGFADGVGANTAGQGAVGNIWGKAGATGRSAFDAAGQWLNDHAPGGLSRAMVSGAGDSVFQDPSASAAAMAANSLSGQIISPSGSTIMGNDFLGQFQVLPVSVYDCGATDSELFAFARYLAMFGSAVSGWLNPRSNIGTLLGGRCIAEPSVGWPEPFSNRTYYQFLSFDIAETIPRQWKDSIESLFKGGVWLMEN